MSVEQQRVAACDFIVALMPGHAHAWRGQLTAAAAHGARVACRHACARVMVVVVSELHGTNGIQQRTRTTGVDLAGTHLQLLRARTHV
jgi:hypothetical protein